MSKRRLIRGKIQALIMIFRDAMYEDIYIEVDGGYIGILSDGTITKSRRLRDRKLLKKNDKQKNNLAF